MNTVPYDAITKKDLDQMLDRIMEQFFDFINVVNKKLEEHVNQKISSTNKLLKEEIAIVRKDLQNYQENTSNSLAKIDTTLQEIKSIVEEMNKNIVGLRLDEKKAHTHSTDML